jgi:hypothetical protein
MENSGKQNPKMGFKPPRAEVPSCKWLFVKNLRSETLERILESRPPPPDVPIKIQDHSSTGNPNGEATRLGSVLLPSR